MQGGVVASNLLKGTHKMPNYAGIPSVVFTTPPLAAVGLTEEAANAQGLRFAANRGDTSDWFSSRRVALRHTAYKTLVETGTRRILGPPLSLPPPDHPTNLFAL